MSKKAAFNFKEWIKNGIAESRPYTHNIAYPHIFNIREMEKDPIDKERDEEDKDKGEELLLDENGECETDNKHDEVEVTESKTKIKLKRSQIEKVIREALKKKLK